MAHGMPDWWGSEPSETTYRMADMAELAARLGSIVTFDRRGNVVFLDDFENGLTAWSASSTGAAAKILPVSYPTMTGGLAIMLAPDPIDGAYAEISHILPYPVLGGIGLECGIVIEANLDHFTMGLVLFDGDVIVRYQNYYYHDTGELKLKASDGTQTTFATPGIQREGYGVFQRIKMVVDILTGKYMWTIFNENVYDTSEYSPHSAADATKPSMAVALTMFVSGANSIEPTVDNVIVTQNEPV